jgi:hypothetical protein
MKRKMLAKSMPASIRDIRGPSSIVIFLPVLPGQKAAADLIENQIIGEIHLGPRQNPV